MDEQNSSGWLDFSSPQTLEAWVLGIVSSGAATGLIKYVDSPFFNEARNRLKKRTGLDIQWIVAAYGAFAAGRRYLPWVVEKFRYQACSSVTISKGVDAAKYNAILAFVANQTATGQTAAPPMPRFKWHGEHSEVLRPGSEGAAAYGSSRWDGQPRFLWHNGRYFSVETYGDGPIDEEWSESNDSSVSQWVVVSCFGQSDKPVRDFIAHCEKMSDVKGKQLQILNLDNRYLSYTTDWVPTRGLDTIDLPREELNSLRQQAEDFFDERTRSFYKSAGQPHRLGVLLYGPPGTGKTSLATAVASHLDVPLVLVKLGSIPGDEALEQAFNNIPKNSVVLLEDIDSAGISCESRPIERAGKVGAKRAKKPARANDGNGNAEIGGKSPEEASPPPVTLSGLLNVIDGAGAGQGRLLMMTTNAPKSLDKALYRPGRVDRIILMGYCTKETAEMAFKRVFGNDPRRTHTLEAIERYAAAFRAQFPRNTNLVPAGLTQYLITYRGNPHGAIRDFPNFLR
jgi:chaperone BCS1